MRYHAKNDAYALRHDVRLARALFVPENLVAARFEPTITLGSDAVLDLVFAWERRYGAITGIEIEGPMLLAREASPFLWPAAVRAFCSEETLAALEDAVEPWLIALTLGRNANGESLRHYTADPGIREDIDTARERGLIGAASLTQTMQNVAPFVYAYRFAHDRRVCVRGTNGASGSALLAGRCAAVSADDDAFAKRWFSTLPISALSNEPHLYVEPRGASWCIRTSERETERSVPFARPIPSTTLVSFDPGESVESGAFTVQVGEGRPLRRCALGRFETSGTSSGRIALIVREDFERIPASDTDAVRTLRFWLEREGFDAHIVGGGVSCDAGAFDLAHVVGHRHLAATLPFVEAFAAARVPIVAAPYADDTRGEGVWGSKLTPMAFNAAHDEAMLAVYLRALANRRLTMPGAPLPVPEHAHPTDTLARLLAISGAAIASGSEEERILRERYGFDRSVVSAPAYVEPGAAVAADAIAGFDDYVFVHAPIAASTGVLFAAVAAAREKLPLIVYGPVADTELAHHLRAVLGERAAIVSYGTLDEAQLEGLYAGARVFAAAGWTSTGLQRLSKAGAYGAALVAPAGGYARDVFGEGVTTLDPASIDSVARGLRTAWDTADSGRASLTRRVAERCDPYAAFLNTLAAYQAAAASKALILADRK